MLATRVLGCTYWPTLTYRSPTKPSNGARMFESPASFTADCCCASAAAADHCWAVHVAVCRSKSAWEMAPVSSRCLTRSQSRRASSSWLWATLDWASAAVAAKAATRLSTTATTCPFFTGCPRSTKVATILPLTSAARSLSWLERRVPVRVSCSGMGCSTTATLVTWMGAAASRCAAPADASAGLLQPPRSGRRHANERGNHGSGRIGLPSGRHSPLERQGADRPPGRYDAVAVWPVAWPAPRARGPTTKLRTSLRRSRRSEKRSTASPQTLPSPS